MVQTKLPASGDMPSNGIGYPYFMTQDDSTTPEDTNEPQDPGAGSGRGGDLGTPSGLLDEGPPSADQEANEAVSGGGMVQPSTEGEPKDTVDKD